MHRPALQAAAEINALWLDCVEDEIDLADCPDDETIAEIIDRYFGGEDKQTKK